MPRNDYDLHAAKWRDCEKCELCQRRKRAVLYRGDLPCQVLLVGEAPGTSENTLGVPFIGEAGKLLERMLRWAGKGDVKVGFTNAVACIPLDDENRITQPEVKQIIACSDRLQEIVEMARPLVIVGVGKSAEKALGYLGIQAKKIMHPAAMMRMEKVQKDIAIQRNVVDLRRIFESVSV